MKKYFYWIQSFFGSDDMVAGVELNDKIEKKSRIMKTLILCINMTISLKLRAYYSSKIC